MKCDSFPSKLFFDTHISTCVTCINLSSSRCYFICKFAAHLHSWTAFIYASTDLLLHELVREIHLKLFFNTLSFHSSHAFTLSSFALLPFSSIPSV